MGGLFCGQRVLRGHLGGVCAAAKAPAAVPLGQNTMLFYLYHQPFCCAVPGLVLYEKLGVSAGGTVLVCGAAGLVVPYLFCRLAGWLHLRPLLRRLGLPG